MVAAAAAAVAVEPRTCFEAAASAAVAVLDPAAGGAHYLSGSAHNTVVELRQPRHCSKVALLVVAVAHRFVALETALASPRQRSCRALDPPRCSLRAPNVRYRHPTACGGGVSNTGNN